MEISSSEMNTTEAKALPISKNIKAPCKWLIVRSSYSSLKSVRASTPASIALKNINSISTPPTTDAFVPLPSSSLNITNGSNANVVPLKGHSLRSFGTFLGKRGVFRRNCPPDDFKIQISTALPNRKN
ncbi:hypothetical protein C0J52_03768 [Blattella germanica]|nr:hypothetical protein C0J52_03768 [Blattella germanica]